MSSINTSDKTPKLRKVTIITWGSRGDIQPFVAIGIVLKKAGYAVRVMANPSETHATLLKDFGLEHVSFGFDRDTAIRLYRKTRRSEKRWKWAMRCTFSTGSKRLSKSGQPFYDEFLANDGEHRPNLLLVCRNIRYFGLYAKHVLKIPTIQISLQHFVFDDPTRAPIGMPTLPLGMHNLILKKLILPKEYRMFKTLEKCIADIIDSRKDANISSSYEKESICLDDFLLNDQLLESEVNHSPLFPTLICQSPLFKGALYPTLPATPKLKFVGATVIESTDQIRRDAQSFGKGSGRNQIESFIASDLSRKPVYMGWGSMLCKSKQEMTIFAVEALMMSNKRGIVLGGFAGLSMKVLEEAVAEGKVTNKDYAIKIVKYAKENVIFVDKAPHEWLFPQVSLTVHHGGAGTTNAALRAGVPTIVTPVFLDQFDHSFAVQSLGVGIGFEEQLLKIDATSLSKAIDTVTNDPAFAKRAKEVGDQARKECGCQAILEEVERFWTEDVITGKFFEDIKDWKVATKEMKSKNERKALRSRVTRLFQSTKHVVFVSALVVASIAFFVNRL